MKDLTQTSHPMDVYFDETVKRIAEILRFDSSLKDRTDEYPFGKETADCLQYFLDLAESLGFETKNYDNYAGEVIFGEGEPFGILAHLDVVPAGNGWKYPPFGGVINDDLSAGGVPGMKIWGRGALDDKGPAVSCLYALYALKQSGFQPKRKIQLIVGCNEECGWKCIEYYKKVAVLPKEGFTPDATFPAIYAEKGILHIKAHFPIENPPFGYLNAGERVNMVCDSAVAFVPRKVANSLVGYETGVAGTDFTYDNTTNVVHFTGKSAHGSTPFLGANALEAAMKFFATQNDEIKHAYDFLFEDVTGLKKLNDETGNLTMSPDVAVYKNGVLSVTIDIRYPATLQKEDVLKRFDEYGVSYEIESYQAPLYNDPNGKLVKGLMDVFNQKFQMDIGPIAIGGGTYARALENGCAFGPEIITDELCIHQANEYVTFDRVKLMNEIYFDAIKALTK